MKAKPAIRSVLVTVFALSYAVSVRAAEVPLTSATIADFNKAFAAGTLSAEQLTQLYLKRIEAYDEAGPKLNAIITLNPNALAEARQLDVERKARGARSPLHGIPVVLKDNFDTRDLPTTGGSFMLKGSIPPDDAYTVRRLREAGAIILAKVNLSEFASGSAMSSLGGQSLNPHDTTRTPSGSSGGTGVAIAADFAPLGMGTDTGGSIRGPSTSNGIVGLKPTHGLLSRAGIIPLALSFATGGPLARSVYDVAVALGTMTGVDPADAATQKSKGQFQTDYTRHLDAGALKGARIGVARDFLGQDSEVDWVVEASLAAMKAAGATIVDVRYPKWLLDTKGEFYNAVRRPEFREQITTYLQTLKPGYPRTHAELIALSDTLTSPRDGFVPNQGRWNLFKQEAASGAIDGAEYQAVIEQGLPMIRRVVNGIIVGNRLDAIVYPTSPKRPAKIEAEAPAGATATAGNGSATNLANLTGFPDLIVPAGFTSGGLPVGLSFFGPAFSEPRLLALGYAFEQRTRALRLPITTPPLPGETIRY